MVFLGGFFGWVFYCQPWLKARPSDIGLVAVASNNLITINRDSVLRIRDPVPF
jgi:hypothetical protein